MIPPNMLNSQGMPSSRLGFVAHPEMPPHINILFRARPPLKYLRPPSPSKCPPLEGIVTNHKNFLELFEGRQPSSPKYFEDKRTKKNRIWNKNLMDNWKKNEETKLDWNPKVDENVNGDPFKTIFVTRLPFEISKEDIERAFGLYGKIKKITSIHDIKTGKPRGYAFIEYYHIRDFKNAYKHANGKKVLGRRVLVDCERGRLVPGWKPRRLGGGKGDTRKNKNGDYKLRTLIAQQELPVSNEPPEVIIPIKDEDQESKNNEQDNTALELKMEDLPTHSKEEVSRVGEKIEDKEKVERSRSRTRDKKRSTHKRDKDKDPSRDHNRKTEGSRKSGHKEKHRKRERREREKREKKEPVGTKEVNSLIVSELNAAITLGAPSSNVGEIEAGEIIPAIPITLPQIPTDPPTPID